MQRSVEATLLMIAILTFQESVFAQVNLDRFYPPVVTTGNASTVVAEGKFPTWPVRVFCDREDVTISAAEKSGELSVQIKEGASPGVAWVRLYDDVSASSLVPLVISPVAVIEETEPNDRPGDAKVVERPAMLFGRLAKSGDCDVFRVTATGGSTLVVSLTGNQILGSPMDAVLQITDPKGNVLVQSDDQRGLDPQVALAVPTTQEFLIRVFAFPETPDSSIRFSGSAAYVYTLAITDDRYLDHVAIDGDSLLPFGFNLSGSESVSIFNATSISPPTASIEDSLGWTWLHHNGSPKPSVAGQAEQQIEVPAVVFGHIDQPDEQHSFSLAASKGLKYLAEVHSQSLGYLVDSRLEVVDPDSDSVLASNDDKTRGQNDARIEFTAKSDGPLLLKLEDLVGGSGPRHFYRLDIRESEPDFTLSVSADRFTIAPDKPLEVPVAVERISGFNGKIRIAASGLPDGVSAEPVISQEKGDTSKSVKLKLTATDPRGFQGSFRISGTPADSEPSEVTETKFATFELRPAISLAEFWLTVAPNKTKSSAEDTEKK